MITAYIAAPGFEKDLLEEIRRKSITLLQTSNSVFITAGRSQDLSWAQQTWNDCHIVPIKSIKEASQKLQLEKQKWLPYADHLHRRTELIAEQLYIQKKQKIDFLQDLKNFKSASFALLDENTLIYSLDVFPKISGGNIEFNESKEAPSRAYLKLWELFTVHEIKPLPLEKCIDLGSCPGGWTWVLAQMKCQVISVDKAPIDEKVLKLKNVTYLKKDAFKLMPSEVGKIDWLFSDIICEPHRLYELVQNWKESKLVKNFVCTIKFKGKTDFETLDKFLQIPNSKALHLCHNKHELTWLLKNPNKETKNAL